MKLISRKTRKLPPRENFHVYSILDRPSYAKQYVPLSKGGGGGINM